MYPYSDLFFLSYFFFHCSLYNSSPYGSTTASKNATSLQSSYLSSYSSSGSMTQYPSYAGYNSGTTTFPNVAQNISSASQVIRVHTRDDCSTSIIHHLSTKKLSIIFSRNWITPLIAVVYTETTGYRSNIPDIIPYPVIMRHQPHLILEISILLVNYSSLIHAFSLSFL